MNESTQKQFLDAVRETRRDLAVQPSAAISIRVSPGGYLALAAVLTFVSVIFLRTHHDLAALLLVTSTWTVTPILLATDRLYFDGRLLFRSGLLPLLKRIVQGRRSQISLEDIEQVEVATVRTLRRGGSVRYRYRVEVSGKGQQFVFASGGQKFRQMVGSLLPQIAEHKLDARACELRDYLCHPGELRRQVAELKIAALSVLEQTDETVRDWIERSSKETDHDNRDQADALRNVANRLRIAGRLRESAEAFRRALHFAPREAWMLYEYARLLRSQASSSGDGRLLLRASAALKLALLRAPDDSNLAARVGESFFEFAQTKRAAKALRRAIEIDASSIRAYVTLAEIALSEGKLAHVIHHYQDAARVAADRATVRMAQREADYYARLNDDDDYLNSELRRMTWFESAGRVRKLAGRAAFAAVLVALVGPFVHPFVAGLAWAVASSSVVSWSGALVLRRVLARRSEASGEL